MAIKVPLNAPRGPSQIQNPQPAPAFKPTKSAPIPKAFVEPEFKRSTDPVTASPQFALMKKQAESRLSGQEGTARDAINRRLAAMGNLNSGAALKLEQNLQNDLARQREEAIGGIDIAEAQDLSQRTLAEQARQDQLEQSSLGRRMQGNQFDRSFAQQGGQFDRTFDEQRRAAQFMEGIAGQEHELSKVNTLINSAMAIESAKSPALVSDYFDALSGSFNKQSPGFVSGDLSKAISKRAGDFQDRRRYGNVGPGSSGNVLNPYPGTRTAIKRDGKVVGYR